jgi:hypothetical protein
MSLHINELNSQILHHLLSIAKPGEIEALLTPILQLFTTQIPYFYSFPQIYIFPYLTLSLPSILSPRPRCLHRCVGTELRRTLVRQSPGLRPHPTPTVIVPPPPNPATASNDRRAPQPDPGPTTVLHRPAAGALTARPRRPTDHHLHRADLPPPALPLWPTVSRAPPATP